MIQRINRDEINNFFAEIYETFPDISISITYSKFDENLRLNLNCKSVVGEILREKYHTQLGFYLDSMKGFLQTEKINLNKDKLEGHTFRYTLSGWGLIIMNISNKESYFEIDCNVNSEKRALLWFSTIQRFKSPSLWNWKVVKSTCISINRILRKHSFQYQYSPKASSKTESSVSPTFGTLNTAKFDCP